MTEAKCKIPAAARRELAQTGGKEVVVAAVRTLQLAHVATLAHLGLRVESGKIVIDPPAPPPFSTGLYARRNLNG